MVSEARRGLDWLCGEEAEGLGKGQIVHSNDVAGALTEAASKMDLTILGVQRLARHRKVFGELALYVARKTPGATILISASG